MRLFEQHYGGKKGGDLQSKGALVKSMGTQGVVNPCALPANHYLPGPIGND